MTESDLTQFVKNCARKLGFHVVGISPAEPVMHAGHLKAWLDYKYHGDMKWMTTRFDQRVDPVQYYPECKSVISVGINYYSTDNNYINECESSRISRYALDMDYHKVVKNKLNHLLRQLKIYDPSIQGLCCVDSSPVMEKYWAVRGGLGWAGKHSLVINPEFGSWMFLGELLINKELVYDSPLPDQCGDCRLCMDACPTGAIVRPYVLDARRCISYLTIECRDHEHYLEYKDKIRPWIYGCDICQEVCPKNRLKQIKTTIPEFEPLLNPETMRTLVAPGLTEVEYLAIVHQTAIARLPYAIWLRNTGY